MPEDHTGCLSQRKTRRVQSRVSQQGQPVQSGAEDDRQEVEEERNKRKEATSLWDNFPIQHRSPEVTEEVEVGHNSPRRNRGGQPLQITSERQRKGAATILRFLRCSREPNHRRGVFFVVAHSHIHCYLSVRLRLAI